MGRKFGIFFFKYFLKLLPKNPVEPKTVYLVIDIILFITPN